MKLDAWLLRLHQWIVDISQRKPQWWGQQCAIAMGMLCALRFVLDEHPNLIKTVGTGALLLISGGFWLQALSSAWFAGFRNVGVWGRIFIIGLAAGCVLGVLSNELSSAGLAAVGSSVATLSFYYFAACEPPAPPRRRESRVLGTQA